MLLMLQVITPMTLCTIIDERACVLCGLVEHCVIVMAGRRGRDGGIIGIHASKGGMTSRRSLFSDDSERDADSRGRGSEVRDRSSLAFQRDGSISIMS